MGEKIEKLDLRSITRHSDRKKTQVYVQADDQRAEFKLWMTLGESRLTRFGDYWVFDSYLGELVDQEGDSAYAVSFRLIGIEFQSVVYGRTVLNGYISPSRGHYEENFRVPEPGYNPAEVEGAVPYLPDHNESLARRFRGRRVRIHFGAAENEES